MDIYLITKDRYIWRLTKENSDAVIVSASKKKEVIYKANIFLKDKMCVLKLYNQDGKFQEHRNFPNSNSWKMLT
ncbi:MAG: DUF2188 domain-containing protein [Gammaproteobacteria bacterium]|nr:MAG: DUF2188 domain-containing protein [Gammaproteobacteria bacterium]